MVNVKKWAVNFKGDYSGDSAPPFRRKQRHLNWSPLIGIAVMGIGGVVLSQSYKKQ